MQPEAPSPDHGQIAVFYQRHRTGLVTLVFTDLVDSTALMRQLGDQAGTSFLQQRRQIVRQTLKEFAEGEEIETAGDSFLLIFAKPSDAVRFALLVQARFRAFRHEKQVGLLERIGIHLGEVVIKEHETEAKAKDLYGIQIGACARVMSLAQGGQVLMTRGVFDSARQVLKGEDIPGVGRLAWVSHGPYLLKGIEEPVEICEVGEVGQSPLSAPKTTEKAERYVTAEGEPVLGWRPAIGQEVPNTKWVLEQKLGEGGFGEVWLGRHQTMKELRVFKFCFRADRARSLKREMTLFRLIKERIGDHPNIVSLREVYFDEPPYYVEMDYVAGQDLKTWCEQQGGAEKVPLEVKLEIVAQVADALQAAHDAGVIHRDVKPANILVRGEGRGARGECSECGGQKAEDGGRKTDVRGQTSEVIGQKEASHSSLASRLSLLAVKLTDFGIGQVVSEEYLAGVTQAGFTQTMISSSSSQTGTQLYMAPELLAGKPASTRSDIYSLGVVLYQLLVGDFTLPVTMDWAERVSDRLLREDLQSCFAGDPQKRFAGAAQLAERLRQLPERRQERSREQARLEARERAAYRRGILRTATLALIAVAAFAGLGIFALQKARQEARQRQLVEDQGLTLRHNLYAADTQLAQLALEDNDFGRALTLLESHRPAPDQTDIRGWEWHYLRQGCRGDMIATLPGVDLDFGLAFSPDRRLLVVLHGPPVPARVFDVERRQLVREFPNTNYLCSAAFSPSGPWLALASSGHLEIWNTNTWEPVCVWLSTPERAADTATNQFGPRDRVRVWPGVRNPIRFSPDGKTLVTDAAGGICLWDTADWRPVVTLTNQHLIRSFEFWGDTISFSASGEQVALATLEPDGAHVTVWRTAELRRPGLPGKPLLRRAIPAPKGLMATVLSPDARYVACGYFYGGLGLWEVATGIGSAVVTNVETSVMALQFLSDRQTLAFGSRDRNVHLCRVSPGAAILPVRRFWGHTNEIWSLALSRDGSLMASSGKDGQIHLWDTSRLLSEQPVRQTHLPPIPGINLIGALFSPDSQHVITWANDTGLMSHRLPEASLVQTCRVAALPWPAEAAGWFPEHQIALHARQDGKLLLLDPASGTVKATLEGHPRLVNQVLVSRDGKTLISACVLKWLADGTTIPACPEVWVWNLPGGTLRKKINLGEDLLSLALSPDARTLAAGLNREIGLWDIASGRKIVHWEAHKVGVISLDFSPDGSLLVSGGLDNLAKVWETATNRLRHTLVGHTGGVGVSTFAPDGRTIVTAGIDLSVRFWSATVGRELLRITQEGLLVRIGFSPNGRYLAVSDLTRGRVHVYDSLP